MDVLPVPVLAMWEPWGTLVIKGRKRFETRPGAPSAAMYGRRVVIHACKTRDHIGECGVWPFYEHVTLDELVFGALIGTVRITASTRIDDAFRTDLAMNNTVEFAFGDYTPGRYAWTLEDPHAFGAPVPFRGHQGAMYVDAAIVGMQPPKPLQGRLV